MPFPKRTALRIVAVASVLSLVAACHTILSVTPDTSFAGSTVIISGLAFGDEQGVGQVLYDGEELTVLEWTNGGIAATLPFPKPEGEYTVEVVIGEDVASATHTIAPFLCSGLPATILGTQGDDEIVGTFGDDVIITFGGNDIISGGSGRDVICGGDGNDEIRGGPDGDLLYGEGGDDLINGDDAADYIDGGEGNDDLRGGGGNGDYVFGGPGDDDVKGGDGSNDTCDGGEGNDFSGRPQSCEIVIDIP